MAEEKQGLGDKLRGLASRTLAKGVQIGAKAFLDEDAPGHGLGTEILTGALEDEGLQNALETQGTCRIAAETRNLANAVVLTAKENAKGIVEESANSVTSQEKDSWQVVRERMAPEGSSFWKVAFARLLWIGAKITSFVAAVVTERFTTPREGEEFKQVRRTASRYDFERIFAWLLTIFGKEDIDEEEEERRKAARKRLFGHLSPKAIPPQWEAQPA